MNKIFERLVCTLIALSSFDAVGDDTLQVLEALVESDPKPFVVVEANGKETTNRAQGVVISPDGLVLSVGHVAWIESEKTFTDQFRVGFRGTGKGLTAAPAHRHKAVFSDREDAPFLEHYYPASLNRQGDSRFVSDRDLALFEIGTGGGYPSLEFFSKDKPDIEIGETYHLCHFTFPHRPGDPFFLINPVEDVGVAQTSSGLQYLAKGYYRVGSSGGAILKNGKLIGIQSSAYTVNATGVGEIPLGLISFELVWKDLFAGAFKDDASPSGTDR